MHLLTYRKFFEPEQASALIEILKQNGIEHEVTEDRESLDSLYGDKQFKQQYFVKIKQADFEVVDNILLNTSREHLDSVEKDHYLFSFTNQELYDILSKQDEWSEFDVLLAQRILKERGEVVDSKKITQLKEQRIQELAKPDESTSKWIFAGYFLALLGGLFGIFIGWHLSTFKKTLPNGERVYGYNVRDRSDGNKILFIGLISFLISLLTVIFNQISD